MEQMKEKHKCKKCNREAKYTLSYERKGKIVRKEHYCANHWVQNEGEGCLEASLLEMRSAGIFDMEKDIAKELCKQFPKLARKYKDILKKNIAINL